MNSNLRVAFAASGLVLGSVLGWLFLLMASPAEKYSPVVEQVQDKAVMISVPSVYTLVTFETDGKTATVHESTVPVNYSGSGVLVNSRGAVLSCAHVFDETITGPIVATLSDGTTKEALLIYSDKEKDLALLKLEGNYPYASLTNRRLRLGQEVIAVGNPQSQGFSTSHGIISYLGRSIKEKYTYTQIDAPINPGSSGGPLFNLKGELIGINARGWRGADGLALAIAPSTIRDFLSLFGIN